MSKLNLIVESPDLSISIISSSSMIVIYFVSSFDKLIRTTLKSVYIIKNVSLKLKSYDSNQFYLNVTGSIVIRKPSNFLHDWSCLHFNLT